MPAEPSPIVERRTTFTTQEIAQIKRLLQEAADEPRGTVQAQEAAIGTLAHEIEDLRLNGMTDDDIAAVLTQSVGATITAGQVAKFYGAATGSSADTR